MYRSTANLSSVPGLLGDVAPARELLVFNAKITNFCGARYKRAEYHAVAALTPVNVDKAARWI
jgi:hypothetical protein